MAEPILTKLSGYARGLVPHVCGLKNYEKVKVTLKGRKDSNWACEALRRLVMPILLHG